MIRFIDLRDQITDVEEQLVNFAFYDTVKSEFIALHGCQEWTSEEDFLADLCDTEWEAQRDRFLRKMPSWCRSEAPGGHVGDLKVNYQRGLSSRSKATIVAWTLIQRELVNEQKAPIRYDCGTEEFAEAVLDELRKITARFPGAFEIHGAQITNG